MKLKDIPVDGLFRFRMRDGRISIIYKKAGGYGDDPDRGNEDVLPVTEAEAEQDRIFWATHAVCPMCHDVVGHNGKQLHRHGTVYDGPCAGSGAAV